MVPPRILLSTDQLALSLAPLLLLVPVLSPALPYSHFLSLSSPSSILPLPFLALNPLLLNELITTRGLPVVPPRVFYIVNRPSRIVPFLTPYPYLFCYPFPPLPPYPFPFHLLFLSFLPSPFLTLNTFLLLNELITITTHTRPWYVNLA